MLLLLDKDRLFLDHRISATSSSKSRPDDSLSPTDGANALQTGRQIAKNLIEMTRLRLNLLVLLTTAIGFLLAMQGGTVQGFDAIRLLIHTLIGTAICGCAGSVLNQWVERGTDHLMRRTSDRPIPTGRIDPEVAFWFGGILTIVGVLHLVLFVNLVAAGLALGTIILYSFVYTPMKYRHWTSTIVGAIPGAIPPVIGWAAMDGSLGVGAFVFFLILFAWQMPHFFAIGTKYRDEYAQAGIVILPVVDNERLDRTMNSVIGWSLILAAFTILPVVIGMIGMVGLMLMIVLNAMQMMLATRFYQDRTRERARLFFLWTVMYLPMVMITLVVT